MRQLDLVLYDTLTRREQKFQPLRPPHVTMYNCGPTVYGYPHIGNYAAFLLADLLRRTLEYAGFQVTQVMNITDVGHLTVDDIADARGVDKLEAAAEKLRRTPWDLARHYTQAFFADLDALNIRAAHYYPRATEFVPEMIAIVEKLEKNGYAYRAGNDVYFDVKKFDAYGRLSGNTVEKLEAGARVEVREEKRSPHDFALWKSDEKHVMQWDSPFGRGFPGWHIECSAMSMRFLGETLDIHTGGEDNVFPHHECEIAQSEGATGKPFVKYWLHKPFLLVDGKKMSKSVGNFYTLRDLLARGFSGREVRYLLTSSHYRAQANFTFEGLEGAKKALERIDNFVAKLESDGSPVRGEGEVAGESTVHADLGFLFHAEQQFNAAIAADLNVSAALAALFDLVREGNRRVLLPQEAAEVLEFLRQADRVLGFIFWKPMEAAAPRRGEVRAALLGTAQVGASLPGAPSLDEAAAKRMLESREVARKAKDFKLSDKIRDELKAAGWIIEDTPKGPRVKLL